MTKGLCAIVLTFLWLGLFATEDEMFKTFLLDKPVENKALIESKFIKVEIPVYNRSSSRSILELENGYALSEIHNSEEWEKLRENNSVFQVDIVFTYYPKNIDFWLTDYHVLLARRLKELFRMDPGLNNKNINFRLVLQTECTTEDHAKKLFHGILLYYRPLDEKPATQRETERIKKQAYEFMLSNGYYGDTSVVTVFKRNNHWKNLLVVMDWTGSMYPFSGQAILFHLHNLHKSSINSYTFFNDGDYLPDKEKIPGKTGGIYNTSSDNFKEILSLMHKVKKSGYGGDRTENDVEAILEGMKVSEGVKEIVLIADNNSNFRDKFMLSAIHVPVRIILCGLFDYINPEYVQLALYTGGSLHTRSFDILDLDKKITDRTLTLHNVEYEILPSGDLRFKNKKLQGLYEDNPHKMNISTTAKEDSSFFGKILESIF